MSFWPNHVLQPFFRVSLNLGSLIKIGPYSNCLFFFFSHWAGQTTVIVQPSVAIANFSDNPIQLRCPKCNAEIMTSTHYETGTLSWILCLILCFFGWVQSLYEILFFKCWTMNVNSWTLKYLICIFISFFKLTLALFVFIYLLFKVYVSHNVSVLI